MAEASAKKTCFVVMPMSDGDGYPVGHWDLVYRELFEPACKEAGFEPDRADSSTRTALIMADVLRGLHKADMVLCDLSALRPNVMFELGLRQAFDQPVVLVLDERTVRPFDTSQLRDFIYDSSLRIDLVREKVRVFATALSETYAKRATGEFSLVRLLQIGVAQPAKPASEDATQRAILGSLDRLTAEVSRLAVDVSLKGSFAPPLGPYPGYGYTGGYTGLPGTGLGLLGVPPGGVPGGGQLYGGDSASLAEVFAKTRPPAPPKKP